MTHHAEQAAHYLALADHATDLAELKRLREVNAELLAALEQAEMDIGLLFLSMPVKDHHLAITAKKRVLAALAKAGAK